MSPFDGGKRYNSYAAFLKRKFGCRVAKLSLDAGFSCPNRDGSKGWGGCTFCSGRGSGDFAGDPALRLREQLAQQKQLLGHKWPDARYIAYFQAHSNTYGSLERLRALFEEPLKDPEVLGLSIATRADCLDEAKADYLAQLSRRCFVEVELGLQSVFDETGRRINRCHSFEDFLAGYRLLQERQLPVCVHLIDGLPGEDRAMMLRSAQVLGQLRPHSVKLHLLHVLAGTALARDWARGEVPLLSREDYVSIICDQLEWLPPQVVIQRLTGDGDRRQLLGPLWSLNKRGVLNAIDKELIRRDSWQGKALASAGEGGL